MESLRLLWATDRHAICTRDRKRVRRRDGGKRWTWSVGRIRDMQRWRAAVEARTVIAPELLENGILQHNAGVGLKTGLRCGAWWCCMR